MHFVNKILNVINITLPSSTSGL